ncbi:hypothetical protein N307_12106, partial [Dryobates pubescens]
RLNPQQLQRRFRSLQLAVHPDRFGQRPPVSAGAGVPGLALLGLGDCAQSVRAPQPSLLLELHGVEPAQETDYDADSVFLMEIMEINEKLSESENEDNLQEMETLIKAKQEELTKEVTAAFERDDLQEAKKLLAKMKYFANLQDKLKQKKIPS